MLAASRRAPWRGAVLALALVGGCSEGEHPPAARWGEAQGEIPPPDLPPTARWEVVADLRADLRAVRHPSDGGGRAWVDGHATAIAGQAGSWTIVYEAGPLGIAEGGALYLQVSPFWGWSTPQVEDPLAPGFTRITCGAAGVRLVPRTLGPQLLAVENRGRPLRAGEQVRIEYGAGPAGARADTYAESASRFWVAVDGDGDGVRKVVSDSPAVDVLPGPPARLLLTLPSTARPGASVRLAVAVLDAAGNAGVAVEGDVELEVAGAGLDGPARVRLDGGDGGCRSVEFTAREEGVFRIAGRGPGGLEAESNPLVVAAGGPRILWGDLHAHTDLSDGTGEPDEVYRYARDVAALDVAAITDHDHWGMRFLDQQPRMWEALLDAARRFHEPGRFVTLPGYEWTSWIHGHRHVLYFADAGELFSSMDERYDRPEELWAALCGRPALTFAHHSAGSAIATDWSVPPDPELEPVTEIVSVHGCSEAADSPRPLRGAVAGNFVRDALGRGYRLGFVGSGDTHDGHPGLGHLSAHCGGLAAILSEEATREKVYEALRARRAYATSGPRIVLRAALAGRRMGAVVPAAALAGTSAELVASVVAVAPLERMDLVRSGAVVGSTPGEGRRELVARWTLDGLRPGELVYVRAVQEDGHAAWSSPFFVE